MIFALTEQTAATLSAAGFSAVLASGVALVVFAVGQYLVWRLEHTKHLRSKLEEMVKSIIIIPALNAKLPKTRYDDCSKTSPYAEEFVAARSNIESLQKVYFPQASIQVSKFLKETESAIKNYALLYSILKAQKADPLLFEKKDPEDSGYAKAKECHREGWAKLCDARNELLEYLAQDQIHLTRVPLWMAHFMK